ncbi:MAG TPA: hypothetical protein PLK54_11185 [Ferruginibacter sp.]|mgnify:CR=1 FL=1|jgi:hypothetical protein|nr:hypothetical protein [Ferruginibacter sp.]MBN8698828.1 hypothetical protein [Chitinophagales bacterium]HMU72062.1 hypothetical protein [Ferruginibacter sp.]HMW25328.1 hypothetical protein [Ferruginibacter sp.]HMX37168.1 hypothetical protein [Ferruginibacter sp.]
MKQICFLLLLSCGLSAYSQKTDTNRIVGIAWQPEKEHMSGIGTHLSMPAGASLMILANHTWQSTEAIDGVANGSWVIDKQGLLRLMTTEKRFLLVLLTADGRLKMTQKTPLAVKTIYWKTK